MIEIKNCPSSLVDGFDIDEFRTVGKIADAMHRISVSGVQEKFSANRYT